MLIVLKCPIASGHERVMSYCQIVEQGDNQYNFFLKVPLNEEPEEIISARVSGNLLVSNNVYDLSKVRVYQFSFKSNSILEELFELENLPTDVQYVIVEFRNQQNSIQPFTIDASNPKWSLKEYSMSENALVKYLILGFEHVTLGLDHLLFVLGFTVLLIGEVRKLLLVVTAFTVAHSITLSISILRIVQIPIDPVEIMIAMSILLIAIEIIDRKRPDRNSSYYWSIAFLFGLLHGFGFASSLGSIGLPQSNIFSALLLFNVGVEIGQVFIILIIVLLNRVMPILLQDNGRLVISYVLGSVAVFWVISRFQNLIP